ncbi:hypothetical protein ABIE93_005995 [Bradyrhizobium elkanii]|uniref:hypothetical protein n=1 Tax=Bradyrhizobium elkanii TaxID=29448 RepID=UPI00351450E6
MTDIAPDVAHWLTLLSEGKATLSRSEMWDIATVISRLNEQVTRSSERIAVVQGDLDRESKEAESYHAFWIEERSKRIAAEAAVKAERERCAKIAEPKGPRPCDCEYGACYCRNAGDAAAVASWDADMAVARAIRAPVSGSTEAGNG